MTVAIKQTAFANYLRSLPKDEAVNHLFHCLILGPVKNNMADELWEEVHPEVRIRNLPANQMRSHLVAMIDALGPPHE